MTDGGFADTVEQVGKVIDWVGVAVIVIGLLLATVLFVRHAFQRRRFDESYRLYRQRVGKRSCSAWSSWSPPTSSARSRLNPPSAALGSWA